MKRQLTAAAAPLALSLLSQWKHNTAESTERNHKPAESANQRNAAVPSPGLSAPAQPLTLVRERGPEKLLREQAAGGYPDPRLQPKNTQRSCWPRPILICLLSNLFVLSGRSIFSC